MASEVSLAVRLGVDGAGGQRFPFGRWNREQPHRVEIQWFMDDDGLRYIACEAICCTCGSIGDVYEEKDGWKADWEAEQHLRKVHALKRAGLRVLGPVF